MKKININSQQTHFIGSWDLENRKLCDEIIAFFENNKSMQKKGASGAGLDLNIKKTTDIRITPNDLKNTKAKITRLAKGVPVGGEIEFLDDGTLFSAFKNRAPIIND